MLTKTSVAVVVLLALASVRPAFAADGPAERQTLKGIKVIAVVVEALRPEVERDGLTRAQIKTDVEERLRQAGIRVDDGATATLYVDVNALLVGATPVYALSAHVDFEQDVVVRELPAVASTWSIEGIATVGQASLPLAREFVRDKVDKFVSAYLAVNPKP